MFIILDEWNINQPFPDIHGALDDPNGLLAMGGCLSPRRLYNAYRQGVFPWYSKGEPILWWSPDPRWVLMPEAVRVSRSLRKRLQRKEFRVTYDQAFAQVIKACAEPRDAGGTWITPKLQLAYTELHEMGLAHSFESWQGDQLVGGLYGVTIGQVFFGESMFHRVTDASKVAFVTACRYLHDWGYRLIDCQVHTSHLESLGARPMARTDFALLLQDHCERPVDAGAWRRSP